MNTDAQDVNQQNIFIREINTVISTLKRVWALKAGSEKKMAEFIDMIDGYKIQKGSRGYIVSNVNGKYENHGHFQKLSTCYVIIRLLRKNTIPKSPYLIEAARRITIDHKYKETLTH